MKKKRKKNRSCRDIKIVPKQARKSRRKKAKNNKKTQKNRKKTHNNFRSNDKGALDKYFELNTILIQLTRI